MLVFDETCQEVRTHLKYFKMKTLDLAVFHRIVRVVKEGFHSQPEF